MHEIEIITNIWLQGIGEWLSVPMQLFSFLGTQYFQIILMAFIYWCVNNQVGIRLGIAIMIGSGFNTAFKWLFRSPRPYWISTDVKALSLENSFGIPSGHAMVSTIAYGRIALWVRKRWCNTLIALLLFLIGISRIYLGVHFLSDVIAGWCLGISFLVILFHIEKPLGKWISKKNIWAKTILFFLSSVIIILFFTVWKASIVNWQIPESWKANIQAIGLTPASIDPFRIKEIYTLSGLWFGSLTGYAWLNKCGGFQSKGTQTQYLFRLLIGFAGLGMIFFLFSQVIDGFTNELMNLGAIFIQYSLISIWITAVAPLIFVKIGLAKRRNNKE